MDYYCVNHTQEKAVGLCGTCQRPACYRCSLNVNDSIFCSLECFNKLSPPSEMTIPAMREEAAVPTTAARDAASLDEYSDVMAGLNDRSEVVLPVAAADDESVILKSDQALDPTTMLGMTPVPGPARDGSTLILIPGTRRAVMSSSCFFHPDTSAIVLCSKCRSPICSLCAKETPEGLTCSPVCGPPDPVGIRERRQFTLFNIGLAVAAVLVLAGGIFITLSAGREPEPTIALSSTKVVAEEPAPAPVEKKVETPAPTPAPAPEPPPVKVEPPPVKVEPPPPPVKVVEEPQPAPPPPVVVEPPKPAVSPVERPEPVAVVAPVAPPPPPPPPAPPPAREPTQLEVDLVWAASLLREAAPLLGEVANAMHPEWKADVNLPELAAKLSVVDTKLKQARELYLYRMKDSPDPTLVSRRIDVLTEVIEGLQWGFDQIRERDRALNKWRKRS